MKYILQVLVIGLSLGWLIGMSESPVIASVITTLLALIISAITIMSGIESSKPILGELTKVKMGPITILIFSIALGSIIGIFVRTNNYLGRNIDEKIKVQEIIQLYSHYGIDSNKIALRLFNANYPEIKPSETWQQVAGVLKSARAPKDCDQLCYSSGVELRNEVKLSADPAIASLASISDDIILQNKIKEVCGCK